MNVNSRNELQRINLTADYITDEEHEHHNYDDNDIDGNGDDLFDEVSLKISQTTNATALKKNISNKIDWTIL